MTNTGNLDLAINGLTLIRNAQRATESVLRLPAEDRAAVAGQVEAVRDGVGQVAASLASTIPGARPLADAGQTLGGGLAQRPELKAVSGMVGFFARQGSEALGAVAGAAGALGGEDRSLALSDRIAKRLEEVGVATRDDLARELDVEPGSSELQDALERALSSGRAEWLGAGTYGLPREQLEEMISRARVATEDAEAEAEADDGGQDEPSSRPGLGAAIDALNGSLDELRGAVASLGSDPG